MKQRYDLLKSLHLATGIPISIANMTSGILLSHPDLPLPTLLSAMKSHFQEQNCDSGHPLLFNENSFYFSALAQLGPDSFVMLGPSCPIKYGEPFLREHLLHTSCASDTENILELLLHQANCSIQNMTHTLCLAVHILSGKLLPVQNIRICSNDFSFTDIQSRLIKNQYETAEQNLFHTTKAYEDMLFEAVRDGDPEVLQKYQFPPLSGVLGTMSLNSDRQKRYIFVTAITLICRAAMQGGLDAETAFAISDTFCQQMDSLSPPIDTNHLYISAIETYIRKVQEAKQQQNSFSPQIDECCSYIKKNIQSKLSLTKIAEHCELSSSYLSRKFLKETGVSVTDYISRMKLERASQMLRYTTFSISEISNILQYCSQSHFTEQFKARYHMTPKKYRDTHEA